MAEMNPPTDEILAIRDRYARRGNRPESSWYNPLDPYVCMARQERERALVRCFRSAGLEPLGERRVLEIGCGDGTNLVELTQLGFRPQNLVANELQEDRLQRARERLPPSVVTIPGDASTIDVEEGAFDVVLQSTVFTSILDDQFQQRLASRMWELVRPRGGILWYDFVWDNPQNPDVRGVPVKRIRELFPEATIDRWPITLAPPIGRRICKISPRLYTVANAFRFLRTHVLCWIQKPSSGSRTKSGRSKKALRRDLET